MVDSNAEVIRAVADLARAVDDLRKDLVRKDVYDRDQELTDLRFSEANRDVTRAHGRIDKIQEDKKQTFRSLVFPAIVGLFLLTANLYVSIALRG